MTSNETTTSETTGESTVPMSDQPADDVGIDWEKAQRGTRLLLEAMGRDSDDEHLKATWKRRVPDLFETFSEGQRESAKPMMRTFDADGSDLVVKTGIPVYSLCEHHLLPYHGTAHVAYRPDKEIVGLSKLVRYVRWQARKPSMQEQLTSDIAHGLSEELDAEVVLVEIEATHMCEAMRGVETETATTTRSITGTPTAAERERFTNATSNTQS
jgi:GTP cyclohydrolase I